MPRKKTEKFEESLNRLEKIVETLEKGDLPLEDAVTAFTEGIRVAQQCQKKLEEAEQQVEKLLKDESGAWSAAPLETPVEQREEES